MIKFLGLALLGVILIFNSSCSLLPPTDPNLNAVCIGSIKFYEDPDFSKPVKNENLGHGIARSYIASSIKRLREKGYRVSSHKEAKEKAVRIDVDIYYYFGSYTITVAARMRAHREVNGKQDKYLFGISMHASFEQMDQRILQRVAESLGDKLLDALAEQLKR